MNNYILLLNKNIVEYCINHRKWKLYLLYLSLTHCAKHFFKRSHKKILVENKFNEIIKNIDESLYKLNLGNKCLIRSSIAMIYLSGYKNIFVMKVGVVLSPFRAHSWITLDDTPVCEAEDISEYTVLLKI